MEQGFIRVFLGPSSKGLIKQSAEALPNMRKRLAMEPAMRARIDAFVGVD